MQGLAWPPCPAPPRPRGRHLALAGALVLLGCPAEPPGAAPPATALQAWCPIDPTAAPEHARAVARAETARNALTGALSARLQAALAEGGPVAAIGVCQDEAPRIAAEVAAAQGVAIGRTAARLRNPGNAAPSWAADEVARGREGPWFATGPEGRLAALYPLRTAPLCVTCHGPAGGLAPAVREALAARYPRDAATGFAPGDLRGWVWVEVPRAP